MLGKIKVKGRSVNDPIRLMKSPIKGRAAVISVFPVKTETRRMNLRLRFSLE